MDKTSFTIEKIFDAPVEKVWQAITDKDAMKKWYFDLKEFKPEVDFEFQFYGEGKKGEQYLHLCKITEVIPLRKLTHTWCYDKYQGLSYLTFEFFSEENKTRLKLTHAGLETFPANNPDFARESFTEGWTYIINTSLEQYLQDN
jgi:uncharacterized protein YndB with AHSA1/START domain